MLSGTRLNTAQLFSFMEPHVQKFESDNSPHALQTKKEYYEAALECTIVITMKEYLFQMSTSSLVLALQAVFIVTTDACRHIATVTAVGACS